MRLSKKFIAVYATLIAVIGSSQLWGADVSFTAEVQPSKVAVGEHATWIVTAHNLVARQVNIAPPSVDGLQIKYSGSVFNQRFINGVSKQSTVWRYLIYPTREGEYTLPEITVEIQGHRYTIPSTTLSVGAATQTSPNNAPKLAFLHLNYKLPNKWYIGQSLPMKIQLYVQDGTPCQLTSLLQKNGDAFAATRLAESPVKSQETVNGIDYQCVSWDTLVTPLKLGKNTLNFNLDLSIAQSTLEDDTDDLFSFFNRSVNGFFTQTQEITLTSPSIQTTIQDLPSPQPASFHQAIGQFQMATPQLSDKEVVQNEAVTLKLTLHGSGNFERIQEPTLSFNDDEWRTYAHKSHFEPEDHLGFSGKMTYEYIIVPLKTGQLSLPTAHFCFFDSNANNYVNIEKAYPFKINVKPAIHSRPTNVPAEQLTAQHAPTRAFDKIILRDIQWEKKQGCYDAFFYKIQCALGVLSLILAICGFRHRKRNCNEHYRLQLQTKQQCKSTRKALMKAFKQRDAHKFYENAYQLIELTLRASSHAGQIDSESIQDQIKASSVHLTDEQMAYVCLIEQKYQQSKFSQSNDEECPTSLKQLTHLLKHFK